MSELRKDPVTSRWVIISTGRAKRPTDFAREVSIPQGGFCPFCPGNESKTPPEILAYRSSDNGAHSNGPGWSLRVVPNKFPALGIEGDLDRKAEGIFDKMHGVGAHEVIIETPDHNLTLSTLPEKNIEDVLWAFRDRIVDLRRDRRFRYILVFKNHGEAAGASLEHPHCQLIALPIVPLQVFEEVQGAKRYYELKERCIFCDIVHQELATGSRVVAENERFLTVAPYAPRFPFETWILPKNHQSAYEDSPRGQFESLARTLKSLIGKMENVLDSPSYHFVIHSSPLREDTSEYYHWHIEVLPKLTRVAGFEWGSGFFINPTPPEEAAKFLREAAIPQRAGR